MRRILVLVASLALVGSGATLALATGGHHGHPNGGQHQYKPKPGCGPDKTDGVAGNSGRHSGQPPKDDNRGDCPNPPGQCKDKGSYKSGYWWHHDSKPSWCKPADRHCYHDKSSSKYKKYGKYYWWYGWDCSYKGKWYDKDKDHYHH